MSVAPRVAVVVPTLEEAANVGLLLEDLAAQRGASLEVVVADGGSADGTAAAVEAKARQGGLPVSLVAAPWGRGRQMNAGAAGSSAPELLFLHADSRLEDRELLSRALATMEREREGRGTDRLAGHFGLRFRQTRAGDRRAYRFYEAKARLNRPDCINGDQGFWLSRSYFRELGGFWEGMAFFEDAKFADLVFSTGGWVALPGTIGTSARRFDVEGLWERQVLNALLRVFHHVGPSEFFRAAAGAYRGQDRARRLDLQPYFREAHRALWSGGPRPVIRRWRDVGAYVRSQAWQLALLLDVFSGPGPTRGSKEGPGRWLKCFDRRVDPLLNGVAASGAAALLAGCWFYSYWVWVALRSGKTPKRRFPRFLLDAERR